MSRRWPFMAGAAALFGLVGACAAWMASPPLPPARRTYTVCRAAGWNGAAVECGPSFKPPGAEPGTFGPERIPTTLPPVPITRHAASPTTDDSPGFQGTPDLGPADVGAADSGAADGGEPGATD